MFYSKKAFLLHKLPYYEWIITKLGKLGTKMMDARFVGRQRILCVITSIAYFENNHNYLGTSFACFFWLAPQAYQTPY